MSKLPKTLLYQSKVNPASARSYRANIQPNTGGNFGLGDTIEFNIPTRANLVMVPSESYLKFNLMINNNSGVVSTYRLDSCGAHGLIQRCRAWHGSNLLEDIDNYGLLAKELFDIQLTADAITGKQSVLAGTRNDLTGTVVNAAAFVANTTLIVSSKPVNSGGLLGASIPTGAGLAPLQGANSTTPTTFCLNLISMLGSLGNQVYFPNFAITSSPLRLEIQLVDSIVKFCCATGLAGSITVSNVEYVANFIELSDEAMSLVVQSLNGSPLQFVLNGYRNYSWSLAIATGINSYEANFSIPAKFASLKSLFVSRRDKGQGAITFFPYSSITNGITRYNFRIGSQVMPQKAPSTIPEYFAEMLKSVGSIADLNYNPSIDIDTYSGSASVASVIATDPNYALQSSFSFFVGLDLENYVNAPKDAIFAGYNTTNDDIFFVENATTANIATAFTLRYDAFAMFDQVLVCENGTCYVKY